MQLLYAMIGLVATLLAVAWLGNFDLAILKQPAYRWIGASLVFGIAFLLTRNLGAAAVAVLAFSLIFQKNKFDPRQGGIKVASPSMTLAEAYDIFGLKPGATRDEIQNAYWKVMKRNHPDQGGSTYFAARINEAKEFLLRVQTDASFRRS